MQLENIKKISFLVAILLLFLAFVLLAGFFFENKALKEDKIILGVIAPISGSYSVWGNNELKGFELAKEELLSKGISNFDFVVEDSSGDSTKAVSSATKLLSEDGVDLLYTNFTGPAVAVAPLANDSNKIHLYEAASTSPAPADRPCR